MNHNNAVFYVAAPDYTEMSSGRKVLHILCHELNCLGFESYVTANITNSKLRTPKLNSHTLSLHREQKRMQIAIYPEIWMDNPLGVPYVIRWLLNKPNFFQKNWFGSFPKEECVWHFRSEFKPPWVDSTYQHLGLLDRELFNLEGANNSFRNGFIIYKNRIEGRENLPSWVNPIEYISIDNPKSSYECSQLYKKSKALILYESAACHAEAALCGCTVITREHQNFDASFIYNSYWKLSTTRDFNENTINLGHDNGKIVGEVYDFNTIANLNNLKTNILEAVYRLKYNSTQEYIKRSMVIEAALRHHVAKDFNKALQGWNYLINKDPSDLKVRYEKINTLLEMKDKEANKEIEILLNGIKDINQEEWMKNLSEFVRDKFLKRK